MDELFELMQQERVLGEKLSDIDVLYDNIAMTLAELYFQWKDDGKRNYDTEKSVLRKAKNFAASNKALAFLLRQLTDIKNEVLNADADGRVSNFGKTRIAEKCSSARSI